MLVAYRPASLQETAAPSEKLVHGCQIFFVHQCCCLLINKTDDADVKSTTIQRFGTFVTQKSISICGLPAAAASIKCFAQADEGEANAR